LSLNALLLLFQTIEEMTAVSDSHAAVSALQAEANSANGVNRLVDLLNKVLRRLQRQVSRRSKRMARQRKGCKIVRSFSLSKTCFVRAL
jgi:hypothetical protein